MRREKALKKSLKMKTKAAALVFVLCLLLCVCACADTRMTADEIKAVLPDLVENSVVLNEIYFGEGFPPTSEAAKAVNVSGYYYVDCEFLGFYSITEIKEATEKIFTPEYAALLYQTAFDGFATDDTVVAARYIEGELGLMQSMHSTVYELPERSYDYSTLQIVKNSKDRARITVETVADGDRSTVELIVVRTTDADGAYVYRLDSPTY